MSSSSLVLVTGISGYLGAHVVDQLVRQGYRVRGTVRSAKLAANQEAYKIYGDAVEVVALDDLIKGSYTDALKGVDAVIHLASPLVGREATAEQALDVTIEGSLNILRQAEAAGVKNFSYASSVITFTRDPNQGRYLADDEWFGITREAAVSKEADGWVVYAAEKVLAEQAVWDFVDKHPHVEMTTVNPPFFYGPFAPAHKSVYDGTTFAPTSLSTMGLFWNHLKPKAGAPPNHFVDIRDVARALVAALTAPPASQVGRKRILIASDRPQPSELVELITNERPELAHRINEAVKAAPDNLTPCIDNKRLKEVLGLEVLPWKKTVLDSVDAIMKVEDHWKSLGTPLYS
ncbi:hypothetical protein EIP91_003954 [Steccherinum ochraceum]|uniref:NAD-dependent epimerase/dehydratase domain-containing protein n=1 Tax=Steccherinum ochraceum TaxID=92696 RepID=A0A4R0RUP0_9APHY|nr:hypothetical protein EIP91_003954 [Steccherinum ochraceum]